MALSIEEIKQLKIWKFLGDNFQTALENNANKLSLEEQENIKNSLLGIQSLYDEIMKDGDEKVFLAILQASLLGMLEGLSLKMRDLKKLHWDNREKSEHNQELVKADGLLSAL